MKTTLSHLKMAAVETCVMQFRAVLSFCKNLFLMDDNRFLQNDKTALN
jgi:hypothetical protein